MKRPGHRYVSASLALALALVGTAVGQDFAVDWWTVDGGGAMSATGGAFALSGTIGQPDAASNPTLSGGAFELTGGFWPVANVCYCLADMNGDGRRDGRDVQKFVSCILDGGDCSCADIDGVNGVTTADVTQFVTNLLAGTACP